jgi:hypothetical protein
MVQPGRPCGDLQLAFIGRIWPFRRFRVYDSLWWPSLGFRQG